MNESHLVPPVPYEGQFEKTVFANGLRVLTENHPESRAVAVGIWIEAGTRDEPAQLMGASHMVEHMVFKGTKTRSAYDIAAALESVGGEINAYTTREYTCFHTLSLNEHLELSLDVLGDLVTNPIFAAADFEREREVILQEIFMSKDQLEDCIFDLMFEKIYRNQGVGFPILGTQETIENVSRDNIFAYYKKWYQPQNMIVTVTGACDHQAVVKFVEKTLGQLKKGVREHKRIEPIYTKAYEKVQKPAEQAHILMSWPTASYCDETRFEAFISNAILGGGMTSRLYQNIREEKGLAYSVYSTLNSYQDCGLSLVYVGTTQEQISIVLEEIKKELLRLKAQGLTEDELQKFKIQLKGQILLGSDDIENRMSSLGVNEMVYGEYRSVEFVIKEIEKVSTHSLLAFLSKDFDVDSASVFLLGSVEPEVEEPNESETDDSESDDSKKDERTLN